jgi:hypothetical protein
MPQLAKLHERADDGQHYSQENTTLAFGKLPIACIFSVVVRILIFSED